VESGYHKEELTRLIRAVFYANVAVNILEKLIHPFGGKL